MNLRHRLEWGQNHAPKKQPPDLSNPDLSHPDLPNPDLPNLERFLTLTVEGAALGVPEVDADVYGGFRGNVARLALQLADRLPDEEKLAQIRCILREFQSYRRAAEEELRNRAAEWRALATLLFTSLLNALGIDDAASKTEELLRNIGGASSAARIHEIHGRLDSFLHPSGVESAPAEVTRLTQADHTTANDNAAGLRGGGSAIGHVRAIMAQGGKGFIILFRLSCLTMINQRFGAEAVEDCLMAVASFLTQSLQSDDAIYHWSDSSLLAVVQGRANEQILTAELERIVYQNRETAVKIGGRATMLRIPLAFDITPIERLQSADDLCKITLQTNQRSPR
jgi:GGDEF domain-containing protein